jgi:hypothetical protein
MAAIAKKFFGKRSKRIPWPEIALIESRIKLRSTSETLGLDAADRSAARWIAKLPGAK